MIGFPTTVRARTSTGSSVAPSHSSRISPSTQERIASVSSASEPGFIIT